MLPYRNLTEAELSLGRNLTHAENLWFRYSASMPDYLLYYHNFAILLLIFTLAPLPIAVTEIFRPSIIAPFKLQPKISLPPSSFLRCYKDVITLFLLLVAPLQLISYPSAKLVGIRASLPLPSASEIAAQLVVYFLVEDYVHYWIHRAMHSKWGYEKIHHVHHEFIAPIGFAAPHAHWAEVLLLGIPAFLGPALAPGHMITFWLWFALRQCEAIDTHIGSCHLAEKTTNTQEQTRVEGEGSSRRRRKRPVGADAVAVAIEKLADSVEKASGIKSASNVDDIYVALTQMTDLNHRDLLKAMDILCHDSVKRDIFKRLPEDLKGTWLRMQFDR